MKLRKAIKKIVALGAGLTMVGATIFSASAAYTLNDFPKPFVQSGKFSGIIVYGDDAKASDVAGGTEIAMRMQALSISEQSTLVGGAVTVSGDSFLIQAGSDDLNLYENFTGVLSIVDSSDMTALADGTVKNNKGSYSYNQFVTLGNDWVEYSVSDNTGADEDPHVYLKLRQDADTATLNDGTELITYKVSFPTALKSDIDSSRDLDDVDNKKITMLGKEYTFTNTDFTILGALTLEMMGGSVTDIMEEGETRTYTIDGVDYETKVSIICDTCSPVTVQMVLNGETTEKLTEGETYTLSDGTVLGIKSISPNEAGDVTQDQVEFYIGADKIQCKDTNSSAGNSGTLTIGTNQMSNTVCDVTWTNTSSELSISQIQFVWQLSEDIYVPVGGRLSDSKELDTDDKDFLTSTGIDFLFAGMRESTKNDVIEIKPSGSNQLRLVMTNRGGTEISEEIIHMNSSGGKVGWGKDSTHLLIYNEGAANNISVNEYFIIENNKYSHLMQLKKIDTTNSELQIKDETGDTETVTYTSASTTFYKDGYAYVLDGITSTTVSPTTIATASYSGTTPQADSNTRADLWTQYEAQVILAGNLTFQIEEGYGGTKDQADDNSVDTINVTVAISSSKLTPSTVQTTSETYNNPAASMKDPTLSLDSNDNKRLGMTKWGSMIEQDTSGDQDTIKITIPAEEAVADVYLTSGATTTSSSEGGILTTGTINLIEVGAVKLASAVANVEAQNTIVVGGPCANAIAAELLGNPAECWTAVGDAGILQLFEAANGNVALLVAGASAEDTQRCARVITKFDDYALVGSKMKVEGPSMTAPTVSVYTEPEPVEPVVVEEPDVPVEPTE